MTLLAMGLAFRSTSVAPVAIEVTGSRAEAVAALLNQPPKILAVPGHDETWRKRLQSGKTNVVVVTHADESRFEF